METEEKVFKSVIVTSGSRYKNNLYDLLSIVPAKPIEIKNVKKYTCDFVPKTDKIYVPKRRPRIKVKTVRDIRSSFESDTYAYLTNDLISQQNYLLKKIRDGCLRNENTRKIAQKVMTGNTPISRAAWQMLININPDDHLYPRQFVVWNGKLVQVNGSCGGNKRLLCNYDLGNAKVSATTKKKTFKNIPKKRKGLLQNSLAVKFKPGPLGRKKFLDDSHQKHHGNIELRELPKVGLVIQPMYGTALEPTITHFLTDLRCKDGTISEKWAEFAVSVLGKCDNSNVGLLSSESLTFDLKYKCDQRRILMRKDLDNSCTSSIENNTYNTKKGTTSNEHTTMSEIEEMMAKILDAVEININQNNMFTTDTDSPQEIAEDSITTDITTVSKDKTKRKYCELGRLDVTVIQLPETSEKKTTQMCGQAYCSFGCICDSLKSTFKFRGHCGREECMFDCKCDFSKYTTYNSLGVDGTDILPGIINIEDEINMRLAKEEQKFHQTVIVTGEKNIVFKSEKRNWKTSKKYQTFYKDMCLKNIDEKSKRKQELSISLLKLNCENVQPWCMVHNLYKCFCKGKFTDSAISNVQQNLEEDLITEENAVDTECSLDKPVNTYGSARPLLRKRMRQEIMDKQANLNYPTSTTSRIDSDLPEKRRKTRTVADIFNKSYVYRSMTPENSSRCTSTTVEDTCVSESSDSDCYYSEYTDTCSRVIAYQGRKYSDVHYKTTNIKIKEMEQNDKTLQVRIMNILNLDAEKEKEDTLTKNQPNTSAKSLLMKSSTERNFAKFLTNANDLLIVNNNGENSRVPQAKRNVTSNNKLVSWLEANYKMYRRRIDLGLVKTSLEPPKIGKVALYAWDFILNRYREKKNLFLISKQLPYRIYMGVHTRDPFFASCMNINEIRFAELHKYPQTVRNLLTNATDMKDNFCILRGLAHCWELVGSVAKIDKNMEETNDVPFNLESTSQTTTSDVQSSSDEQSSFECSEKSYTQSTSSKECQSSTAHSEDSDSSKWFIMTVENDFSEIRFFKKGFFVKYESIVKAINVARMSGKTVRLSSQKCVDKNNGPQFGVYAIPNTSEYCVYIGPYELQDSLGIETMKTILDVRKTKRTRGFWINTNKVDNLKVIDNPLLFMPPNGLSNSETVPLDSDDNVNHQASVEHNHDKDTNASLQRSLPTPELKKVVKPIKIRKTNGFYHLATDGLLKKISLKSPPKVLLNAPTLNTNVTRNFTTITSLLKGDNKNSGNELSKDSETDKGLQIKISAIYSQKEEPSTSSKDHNRKTEGCMLILKPEEINRKLFEGQLNPDITSTTQDEEIVKELFNESAVMESPIFRDEFENSATVAPCTSSTDVYVISDDDDDDENVVDEGAGATQGDKFKDVLIQCSNVPDLGWVRGKQNVDSLALSFKVPGGQYSEFYPEQDAFLKLNEALSTIVGPSRPFDLNWTVVDYKHEVEGEVTTMDCEILYRTFMEVTDQTEREALPKLSSSQGRKYSKKKSIPTSSVPSPDQSEDKTAAPETAPELPLPELADKGS